MSFAGPVNFGGKMNFLVLIAEAPNRLGLARAPFLLISNFKFDKKVTHLCVTGSWADSSLRYEQTFINYLQKKSSGLLFMPIFVGSLRERGIVLKEVVLF